MDNLKTWPERIYLQIHDDDDELPPYSEIHNDVVTWCADQIVRCEVPYIRADLVPESSVRPVAFGYCNKDGQIVDADTDNQRAATWAYDVVDLYAVPALPTAEEIKNIIYSAIPEIDGIVDEEDLFGTNLELWAEKVACEFLALLEKSR